MSYFLLAALQRLSNLLINICGNEMELLRSAIIHFVSERAEFFIPALVLSTLCYTLMVTLNCPITLTLPNKPGVFRDPTPS